MTSTNPPDGWAIEVTLKRMGGGAPVVQTWYAYLSDEAEALVGVDKAVGATPDMEVVLKGPVTKKALLGMGMQPGQVRQWT